jgi:hypothetical protein
MPTDYTGNPATSHGVNLPSLANAVQIKMLVDTLDPLNASAIHGASVNVLADWIEFLRAKHAALTGVHPWDSTRTYTYGMLVTDPDNKRMYRALEIGSNLNKQPGSEATYWVRCDFSEDEIQSSSSKYIDAGSPSGITCTRGASVTRASMVITGNTLKQIMMEVQNVPFDNSITIDMSGSAAKLTSVFHGGNATLLSGGYQYGGNVGLNVPATGHDVFTLWAKKVAVSSETTCTVSISIWGT